MSDDEGVQFSRRSVLAGTAALGLAGSSTAVAEQFGDGAVADTDDGSVVNWDEDAWPQAGFDNGMTSHNAAATGPTGELSLAWTFDGDAYDAQHAVVADGTAYTFAWKNTDDPGAPVRTLYALDAEGGTEQWSAELTSTYGEVSERWTADPSGENRDGEHPIGEYTINGIAIADGVVYASRWRKTVALDAENGEQLWSVEHGGNDIAVTDESLVVSAPINEDKDTTTPEGGRVRVLSREDGSVRWNRTFEDASLQTVVADGSGYVIQGNYEDSGTVYSLSLADGTTDWSRKIDKLEGELVATDDTLYVTRGPGIVALDTGTGDTRWRYDADEDAFVTVQAVTDGAAFITFGSHAHEKELVAVDTATGSERWQMTISKPHDFVVAGDVLYYGISTDGKEGQIDDTTDDGLVLREATTGKLLAERRLPGTADDEDWLYDQPTGLVPVDGMLYVDADDALFAFREASDDDGNGGGGSGDDGSDDSGNDESDDSSDDAGDDGSDESKDDC